MNKDDTPQFYYTKEEIEEIVESKVHDLLEQQAHQKFLLGPEFSEMAENIIKTGAGQRHSKKKKDSRVIMKQFPNAKQLNEWLITGATLVEVFMLRRNKTKVEEQEDGTFIIY